MKRIVFICLSFFTAVLVTLQAIPQTPARSVDPITKFAQEHHFAPIKESEESYVIHLSSIIGEDRVKKMTIDDLATITAEDLKQITKANPKLISSEILLAQSRPIYLVNGFNTPEIWINTRDALNRGQPRTLTYMNDPQAAARNRAAACRNFQPIPPDRTSCDEYPYASTFEGGAGASIRAVPIGEQRIQGGDLSALYRRNNMGRGSQFDVYLLYA